ncbi:MAG TPA: ATP-binding protein [Verrucomicrobiae bacterium]|jgi:signal transduction histidine kinase
MASTSASIEQRILLLAPTGGDAQNALMMLRAGGFEAVVCATIEEVCDRAREGSGAMLLAEEALRRSNLNSLLDLLKEQPSWSDFPVIVVTTGGDTTQASVRAYDAFGPTANLTLIERPFRAITLISAVRTALRSRLRQYEVRDLLEQLEEKVRERTVRLEQTIAELEAFSYSVSHDMRAPLRAMRGYSQVLLDDFSQNLDETGREFAKRILAASERLDRLVQDVLRYSRVAREKIECKRVDLEDLIMEVVGEYPAFHPPNAEVIIAKPLLPVWGHEASLTQVVSNLLGNAVKFVRAERVPKIKIWTEPAGKNVKVFFNDNGIGIEEEDYGKIFRMFERVSAGAQYEGTGIGLAIVAKAVERMGGKVSVESVVGRGSTFCVELPAAS